MTQPHSFCMCVDCAKFNVVRQKREKIKKILQCRVYPYFDQITKDLSRLFVYYFCNWYFKFTFCWERVDSNARVNFLYKNTHLYRFLQKINLFLHFIFVNNVIQWNRDKKERSEKLISHNDIRHRWRCRGRMRNIHRNVHRWRISDACSLLQTIRSNFPFHRGVVALRQPYGKRKERGFVLLY